METFKINKKCESCANSCKYFFSIKIEEFKCKKYKKKEVDKNEKK